MRNFLFSILCLVCLTILFVSFIQAQENRLDDLFPVQVDGKYGFIDRTGKVVIEPQFRAVNHFSEGLARIYVDGKFSIAYIDKAGKITIEPQFDIGSDFSEAFAWVGFDPQKTTFKIGNKTYYGSSQGSHSFNYDIGFINKTGKLITKPVFTLAKDFSEGLAAVRTKEDKFGFIDKAGNFVIKPKFYWASSFSEGLAAVETNGKYGFIDRTGKIVIKPIFTGANDFSEGLALVKIGGEVRKQSYTGSVTTTQADTNYAFIDKTGNIVFRINAEEANSFSDGLARFQLFGQNSYGFVDRSGKVVIEPNIDSSGDFLEGVSQVFLDEGGFGFINKTGNIILKTEYKHVDDFKNGLARVCDSYNNNARCGYIDKTGSIIWNPTN